MTIEVASVQMQSELGKKSENIKKMIVYMQQIKGSNPKIDLIVFPECAVTGYECPEQYTMLAEPYPDGESLRILSQAAREHQVHLIFGFIESEERNSEIILYNSAVLIDNMGNFCGRYRKAHLVEGLESSNFAPFVVAFLCSTYHAQPIRPFPDNGSAPP